MEKDYSYPDEYSSPRLEGGRGDELGTGYHDVDVFGREEGAQVGACLLRLSMVGS